MSDNKKNSIETVWLAPMAGITDMPFRRLVMSFGIKAVITEMVASESLVRGNKKSYRRLIDCRNSLEKVVQIFGCEPESMAEAAYINEDLGATMININMGCPAKKIVNNNGGAYLMRDEDLACRIVEKIISRIKIPVSVKMRLGWDSDCLNAVSLAKKLEQLGVTLLMVHGRTRAQGYSGVANMAAIKQVKDAVKIPVICNGDINYDNCVESLRDSGCDGVMVGRAALGSPWILGNILYRLTKNGTIFTPTKYQIYNILLEHFEENLAFYGEISGIKNFRKHICWYTHGMPGGAEFRAKINTLENKSEIIDNLKKFYSI